MIKLSERGKIILRSLFIFIFFELSKYLQWIPVKIFNMDLSKITISTKALLTLFSSFIVLIIIFLIYVKDIVKDFKKFKNNFLECVDTATKYWFLGLGIMISSNIILNLFLKAGGANNEQAVQSLISGAPWLMLILTGVIAPFNEEFVFRKALKDPIKSKWLFVITSALLFGGAHVISSATTFLDYMYIIPYGALGGAFALAYYDTDTIFSSIFMHMVHNTVLTIISVLL